MELKNSIQEQTIQETTLQVFHRQIKVSEEIYLNSVNQTNPWDERTYQEFIQKYLEEINDHGIVGMVRMKKQSPYIYFDAAIRYPQ